MIVTCDAKSNVVKESTLAGIIQWQRARRAEHGLGLVIRAQKPGVRCGRTATRGASGTEV